MGHRRFTKRVELWQIAGEIKVSTGRTLDAVHVDDKGGLKKKIGVAVNKMLKPLGLSLGSASSLSELVETERRHSILVKEVEALSRELLFKELPPASGRAELLARLHGTTVVEAMYVIDCLHRSLPKPGGVCEFGVAQGATSAVISNEIRNTDKELWLFDSFQGLPKPTEKDVLINDIFCLNSMDAYAGTMACPKDMVESRLREVGFPRERVNIVPGYFPASLKGIDPPEEICFAYIDFDFYEPIMLALRFLDERLAPGGYVVVDDYGFFSSGAQAAVDEFVAEKGDIYEFSLPCEAAGKFCILKKTR